MSFHLTRTGGCLLVQSAQDDGLVGGGTGSAAGDIHAALPWLAAREKEKNATGGDGCGSKNR